MADAVSTPQASDQQAIQDYNASRLSRVIEVLALGVGLAGPRLISLITLPVAYGLLGAAAVGKLAVIEAVIIYIPVIGGMAFATYAQRFVVTREPDRLIEVWQSSLVVVVGLSALSALAVAVIQPPDTPLWFAGIFAAAMQGSLPTWIFRGARNFRDYRRASLLQVAASSTTIILGLIAGWLPIYFLGNITGYLVVLYIARRNQIRVIPRLNVDILRKASLFIPSQAAIQIYVSVDVIIVRLFLGLAEAGRYATLYRAQYFFMALYALFQQFMLPRLSTYQGQREKVTNYMLWASALTFQFTLLLILVLAHSIMPSPFLHYWYVTAILLGQFSIATVGVLPVLYNLTGNPRRYAAITAAGATVNIAANCALIPIAGLAGAAFSTCLSELAVTMLAAVSTSRLTVPRLLVMGASLAAPFTIFLSHAT